MSLQESNSSIGDARLARKRARVKTTTGSSSSTDGISSVQAPGDKSGSLSSAILSESWTRELKRVADIEIGRTIIECNIPFQVLRTEQWQRMIRAISEVGPCTDNWHGVDYRRMCGSMLDDERIRIDTALQPIREGWKRYGCTIMVDGWSDFHRRHMINILVSSCLGTIFLRAVDAGIGGHRISTEFIFGHVRQAIVEIGAELVVQVMTNDALACVRIEELLEVEFPGIVWTPCASHNIDLMMEDIAELPWVVSIVVDATRIITFFHKKHEALSIFRTHSTLDIIMPSHISFAYMYLVLDRLMRVRDGLQATVVDNQWGVMACADHESTHYVQRRLLDSDFWSSLEQLSTMLRPMWRLVCLIDVEGSTMGLLYHVFHEMRRQIASSTLIDPDRLSSILGIIDYRWQLMQRPIHGLAALLHPLYRSQSLLDDPTLLAMRDAYLSLIMTSEEAGQFNEQFSSYLNGVGSSFSRAAVFLRERLKKPLDWWLTHGYSTPVVRGIACRLLSQDCSTSACKGNWAAYSLTHARLRERLSKKQREKLVYCRANLGVIQRLRQMTGPNQVDPDSYPMIEAEEMALPFAERDEQDEIYRMLHCELESIDLRVIRSYTTASCVPLQQTSTRVWRASGGGGGGQPPIIRNHDVGPFNPSKKSTGLCYAHQEFDDDGRVIHHYEDFFFDDDS